MSTTTVSPDDLSNGLIPSYNMSLVILGAVYFISGIILFLCHFLRNGQCRWSWGIDVNLVIGILINAITQTVQLCYFTGLIKSSANYDPIGMGFSIAVVPLSLVMAGAEIYLFTLRVQIRKSGQGCGKINGDGNDKQCSGLAVSGGAKACQ